MTESCVQLPKAGKAGAEVACAFVAFMYHNISADAGKYGGVSPAATAYFVGADAFARQLEAMAECGVPCMAPEDLAEFYLGEAGGQPVGKQHQVLVTFDDGWSDCVDVGGAMVAGHHIKAMLFVTTDFLDRRNYLSRGALARVNPDVFLIGSHARTHRMLSLLGDEEIRTELADSRKILEDIVGRAVNSLSIPNGAVDGRVRRIAVECGYRFVFDSHVCMNRRGDDGLSIGRVAIKQNTTLEQFRGHLSARFGAERFRRMVLEAPKRILGLRRYDQLRRRLLGESRAQEGGPEAR